MKRLAVASIWCLLMSSTALAQTVTYSTINSLISSITPTSFNSPAGEQVSRAFDGSVGSKYLNFDEYNTGAAVRLTSGRRVTAIQFATGNDSPERDPASYQLWGSNDGVNWTSISQGGTGFVNTDRKTYGNVITFTNSAAYTYYAVKFPTVRGDTWANSMQVSEIKMMYDSADTTTSTDTGNGTVTFPSTYVDPAPATPPAAITTNQQNRVNAAKNRVNAVTKSGVYIEQIGSSNTTDIQQYSGTNQVSGIDARQGSHAELSGTGNTVTIKQGYAGRSGKNLAELGVNGNNNNVTVNQGRNANDTMGHYSYTKVAGDSNTVTINQTNGGGTGDNGHFAETSITGNNNNVSVSQHETGAKILFGTVNGHSNSVSATQSGTGQHYLNVELNGNGHNVNSTQNGGANHAASISLTNNGGASSITLQQLGSTPQNYSLQQTCVTAAGCSATVTQQ